MPRNFFPVYFNENYKVNKKKLKMKKNAMDPVNFEEEKKNDPKYKTELCKSFMETNFCVYGNKCRFAHGLKELVVKKQINHYKQKTCNSFFNKGYCPYGSRCNFKHDERKIGQIGIPYYYSHLVSLHLPQLKTCHRLNVFTDISTMKIEMDKEKEREREKEKEKEQIHINAINDKNNEQNVIIANEEEKENKKEKDELSISFSSEMSSQASSGNNSPVKLFNKEIDDENDKEDTEDEDINIDKDKINDFFLKDFNFELDFFSSEN